MKKLFAGALAVAIVASAAATVPARADDMEMHHHMMMHRMMRHDMMRHEMMRHEMHHRMMRHMMRRHMMMHEMHHDM